jgi:tight adherence protein B
VINVAVLCGALVGGGMWFAASAGSHPDLGGPDSTRISRYLRDRDRRRLTFAAGAAVAALVLTRWPMAAAGAGVVAWLASGKTSTKRDRTGSRTEAVALWAEMLRDSMGASRGIEGVLAATASSAPATIRPALQRMAHRLGNDPLETVLDDLATELDDPVGDLVVTALRLMAETGGRRVREVLTDLAAAAYAQADAARRISVARARPRAALTYTAMIIGAFVVLLVLFSRPYLAPYDSAIGQLVLAAVGVYWAGGFWWMARMSRPVPLPRYLTRHRIAGAP